MFAQLRSAMSLPYTVNPMPHTVDIRCPKCSGKATFEFAEIVRIRERKDIDFFRDSPFFEYRQYRDSCGHVWHAAVYIARLHGGSTDVLTTLPDGYTASDWDHSKYLFPKDHPTLGGYACHSCHSVCRHEIDWPQDAYFQVPFRSETLWAFHRESAQELRDYLEAAHRDVARYRWSSMLMKVPKLFQSAKSRDTLVRRLDSILSVT